MLLELASYRTLASTYLLRYSLIATILEKPSFTSIYITSNPTLCYSKISNIGCSSSITLIGDPFWHSSHVFTYFSILRESPFYQYYNTTFWCIPFLPLYPLSSCNCWIMLVCSFLSQTTLFGSIFGFDLLNNSLLWIKNSVAYYTKALKALFIIPFSLSSINK